tara:strand:- start:11240 stop:12244 length:1005 start_codon:yes stop_codon:yes gene_type:complete
MIFINSLDLFYEDIKTSLNSIYNLTLIHKLFIIFLILIFITIVFNGVSNTQQFNVLENFDNKEKFIKKIDVDVYDNYYSKYYDAIHLNKKRNEFEVAEIKKLAKKNNDTKILDIGCGTGYTVELFNHAKYDILGLDVSEDMISKAKSNYPNCEFMVNNILTDNELETDRYSHVLCLGKTIYEIKDKETFFENCKSILSKDGFLIIHLVDRDRFSPYVQNKDKNMLYDPEKYGKSVNELIVKFDKNNEFHSKYKVTNLENNNKFDSTIEPYAIYNEKFINFKSNKVRVNEINLYMPLSKKIINLANSKDFKLFKKIELNPINYRNEYLYVFKHED